MACTLRSWMQNTSGNIECCTSSMVPTVTNSIPVNSVPSLLCLEITGNITFTQSPTNLCLSFPGTIWAFRLSGQVMDYVTSTTTSRNFTNINSWPIIPNVSTSYSFSFSCYCISGQNYLIDMGYYNSGGPTTPKNISNIATFSSSFSDDTLTTSDVYLGKLGSTFSSQISSIFQQPIVLTNQLALLSGSNIQVSSISGLPFLTDTGGTICNLSPSVCQFNAYSGLSVTGSNYNLVTALNPAMGTNTTDGVYVGKSLANGMAACLAYNYAGGNNSLNVNLYGETGLTVDMSGRLYATSYVTYSDNQIKKDIKPIDNGAWDTVLTLDPVSYRYNRGKNNSEVGLIAQDLIKAGLQDFTHAGPDGMLGIDYSRMCLPLLQIVKKQQKDIDELKKRMTAIEHESK